MPAHVNSSCPRIHVSGLGRDKVRHYDGGIHEEDELGWLFYDYGCEVTDVRLMVDPATSRSRGFAFVDFKDEASCQRALELNGKKDPYRVRLDPGPNSCLKVQLAKPKNKTTEESDRLEELTRLRDQTEHMETALRLREARVKELHRELTARRRRQVTGLSGPDVQVQIEEEKCRQKEILRADEGLMAAEEALSAILRDETDRMRAVEAIVATTCSSQVAPITIGADGGRIAAAPIDARAATVASNLSPGPQADAPAAGAGEEAEVCIRNTFIEIRVPSAAETLVRTKTAPAGSTKGNIDVSDSNVEDIDYHLRLPLPQKKDKPSPWAVKREASASLSRTLLEEKMELHEATPRPDVSAGLSRRKGVDSDNEAKEFGRLKAGGSADNFDGRKVWTAAEGSRRVRIRNVPLLQDDDLREQLTKAIEQLWRAARGLPAPEIQRVEVSPPEDEAEMTYAARAKGTEAIVTFARPEDAHWLVEERRPASWSSAATFTLRGRVLSTEWPPFQPPVDWRKLRYKADTDASSLVSYDTAGTVKSFSSAIKQRAGGTLPVGRVESADSLQNRTVVLLGLSTALPRHTVCDEVVALLRRVWQRDGYNFDPAVDLHRGVEGGIVVRPGDRGRGEENNGSCLVRMRKYADAKYLVEQASALRIEGRSIRALWARPRQKV